MEKSELQKWLAQGWSLARIGEHLGKHPETIAYWVRKFGLEPNGRTKHASLGGIDEEELERGIASGLTIAELADLFNCSKGTVRYWMKRYGFRTRNHVGPRSLNNFEAWRECGFKTATGVCKTHGEVIFVLEGRGYYRCRKCRMERVSERRRVVKAMLVAEAGGACRICGYNAHQSALQFHHLDPSGKAFAISRRTRSLKASRDEARHCVLLCANCHAEVEAGLAEVPLE